MTSGGTTANGPKITVFLADDSLLVREGVRALLASQRDLDVVGVAEDFDSLVRGAEEQKPQVVVTDIRMPPNFQNEGIEAAKLVNNEASGCLARFAGLAEKDKAMLLARRCEISADFVTNPRQDVEIVEFGN